MITFEWNKNTHGIYVDPINQVMPNRDKNTIFSNEVFDRFLSFCTLQYR